MVARPAIRGWAGLPGPLPAVTDKEKMKIKTIFEQPVLALLAAMVVAWCATPTPGFAASMTSQPTNVSPSSQNAAADLCANSLVPVKQGATWTYKNTGVTSNTMTGTATISAVRPDGFTVSTNIDGMAASHEWKCTGAGMSSPTLSTIQTTFDTPLPGINGYINTYDPTGVMLPANPQQGQTWQYVLGVTGWLAQGNNKANADGKVTTTFTHAGMESVTVPAGTFNANKITAKTMINEGVNFHGFNVPVTGEIDSTFWFAPNVGWVKAVNTGNLPGYSLNSTTDLQSYNIP